jgi:hypothetical protein
MLDLTINKAAYLGLASTLAFGSVSSIMMSRDCGNSRETQEATNVKKCPLSPYTRANYQMALASAMITSGLYFYRVFV